MYDRNSFLIFNYVHSIKVLNRNKFHHLTKLEKEFYDN